MKVHRLLPVVLVLFAAQAAQGQGVLFLEQITRGGTTTSKKMQWDKTHVRAEEEGEGVVLFDSASGTIRSLDVPKKTYFEIDKAQMEQVRGQLNQAQAQMAEAMKGMSPQERAMMEQMMQGRGMPGMPGMPAQPTAQATLKYRQAGADKVGSWSCVKYEGMRGETKATEVCAVPEENFMSVFGMTAADFETLRQMGKALKAMTLQQPGKKDKDEESVFFSSTEEQGFPGFPIRTITYLKNKVSSVKELKEFRRETFPASTFEVPSGFKKEKLK